MTALNTDGTDEPAEKPDTPTLCTNSNKGRCECSAEAGFSTYTWWLRGQQRCFTVYVPTGFSEKVPVVLNMQCYAG